MTETVTGIVTGTVTEIATEIAIETITETEAEIEEDAEVMMMMRAMAVSLHVEGFLEEQQLHHPLLLCRKVPKVCTFLESSVVATCKKYYYFAAS